MSGNNDKAFISSFAGVIGILVAFTATIIGIAITLTGSASVDQVALDKSVQERIAPIGTVITDPAALMKVSAAAPHAAMSGEQIVGSVCSACHGSGVLGAPKIGDKAAWGGRLKADGGVDGLVASAAKGKGSMPARGGNPDLSNDELKAAIQQMLKQTGV
ncbi:MAG TPA: c-type cytochrome [Nevskia sp.]|nr:c-type cytochrome [Nevskia sp.]